MADKADTAVKAHCPTCDGERVCEVHGKVYKPWEWEDREHGHSMNGGVTYSLLECRGCETVFFESSSWDSEDLDPYYDAMGETHYEAVKTIKTYPKPESKTKPLWLDTIEKLDNQLHSILEQMYTSHDNRLNILTAIGLRTALDRATEKLGIDPNATFNQKLDSLRDGGWIGQTERDILGVVTHAGNAAAHQGWEPKDGEIAQLISAMEVFLQRAFVVGQKALEIRPNIPMRPRRLPAPPSTPVDPT